jgi:hypothetical protein
MAALASLVGPNVMADATEDTIIMSSEMPARTQAARAQSFNRRAQALLLRARAFARAPYTRLRPILSPR